MLAAFILWTIMVCFIDVRAIGQEGTTVGLATLNEYVRGFTGVHMILYTVTDWLSIIPIGIVLGFALLGLVQWVKRKHILRVDYSLLALGVLYVILVSVYLLFEAAVVNYRPVLIDGYLEASYPSSTTLLTMCIMPTAAMQFSVRIKNGCFKRFVIFTIVFFTVFMVVGRFVSGVHWFTDIVGGILLSTGLVMLYYSLGGYRR